MNRFYPLPIAWIWAISVIATWVAIAIQLDQSLWQPQNSRDLMPFGVFKGSDFSAGEVWRLIASQWLHVRFPHMLFNALIIAIVGQALQARTSAWIVVLIGVGGGAIGQLASAVAYPSAFVSGASQAYLALSGAALLLVTRFRFAWWAAVTGVVIAAALDVFVSDHGALKAGHTAAFLTGLAAGAIIVGLKRYLSRRDRP